MRLRYAFTMLELVFVIVIMGIIGKFGVEFLANAYRSFIYAQVNHNLQSNTASAIEFISTRLQYRIKDSIIAKRVNGTFDALASANEDDQSYKILEWVGSDIDGQRGIISTPTWSGIADVSVGDATKISSPATNTGNIDTIITALSSPTPTALSSPTPTSIDDAALYFIGSNSDVASGYGWDKDLTAINKQEGSMHPIIKIAANPDRFLPKTAATSNFKDIYEYYKLAWTAYALVLSDNGDLTLHYDYQPWEDDNTDDVSDETYLNGQTALLMQNVDTFRFMAIGSVVKVQICVHDDIIDGNTAGGYSICKEKTIY